MTLRSIAIALCVVTIAVSTAVAVVPLQLRTGRAGHAFDHLGGFGDQADAAVASGATIIYATGLGGLGYAGLLPESESAALKEAVRRYNADAKAKGIELSIGYVCATSIVKLATFDQNWPAVLRARLKTPPTEWRQQDQNGQPLASWYGGDYTPACMNNPDWRAYEEFMVRQQLEAGHDGIFFDNPTVHPQGCYCPHCMARYGEFLDDKALDAPTERDVAELRAHAVAHPREFMQFRSMIARDFLQHIREFARTINPNVLITCNNSLNAPSVLFSQCRTYGYNIGELSKAEDLVVVEDMQSQPRTEANGQVIEYAPTYRQLHAISHGKPIVAVTLAAGDYHTPPNLVRLAMSEAAAHDASYLSWPTWPEDQRARMAAAIRPQADLLRKSEVFLNDTTARADVVLFLPFRRWLDTEQCAASNLAAVLSQANIQYRVVSDEQFDIEHFPKSPGVLLIESPSILTPEESRTVDRFKQQHGIVVTAEQSDWLVALRSQLKNPSLTLTAPPTIRAVVRDQSSRTIIHLLNLNVQRISSFEDKVTPATDIEVKVRVPYKSVSSVTSHTADEQTTAGSLEFSTEAEDDQSLVKIKVPNVAINSIIVIEP
jgi:hypothetical protein